MKYMLLIYGDEKAWAALGQEQMKKIYAGHAAYNQEMTKAGVLRDGSELKPVSATTSVRFTNGRPRTVDGPFAETKEQLGGYYVIEVDHPEQAIEWAQRMPGMTDGTVEIRALKAGA